MIRPLALCLFFAASAAAAEEDVPSAGPADPDLRFIENAIVNAQHPFLLQTCDDSSRARRVELIVKFSSALEKDYTHFTGREVPYEILIVEGNICGAPDHFEDNLRGQWRDLRKARKLLDQLKASP